MKNIFKGVVSRLFLMPAWFMPTSGLRRFFHILRGVKIGKGTFVGYFVIIDHKYPENIKIGDFSALASSCFLTSHDESYRVIRGLKEKVHKIEIGNKTMVGTGTIIMPGVKIGNGCIIGANSVVNKNVPSDYFAAGSPARLIKKIKK